MNLTLAALRAANVARHQEWDPNGKVDLSFRAIELGGEVGEALNVIKKLVRESIGIAGSRTTVTALSEELADVVICSDLVAMSAGVDLEAAVVAKFNTTSDKVGLSTKIRPFGALGKITMTELAERGLADHAIIKLVENGVIKDYGDLPGDRTGERLTRKEMEAFGLGPSCDCGERGLSPGEDECRMCGEDYEGGIAQILRDVLGAQGARFNPQTKFSDLKTDSLELVQIQVSIEEKYSIVIDDDALSPDMTLAQLTDLVRETAA
jgi:acyl carrier protein/NTP pyrophosphatase (non-canonical NTP hydrolase)